MPRPTALCLWLPTFELRLELVRSPELDRTSVALLAPGEGVRQSIWQVSERGWDAGVRPGHPVSQAVALCPALTLLEPDPVHYDGARDAMLEVLGALSPVVEPDDDERGKVFLGMAGLDRLYGAPERQVRRVLRELLDVFPPPVVAAVRAGMAPGTFAAWVAAVRARAGDPVIVDEDGLRDFLASCPVGALPVDATVTTHLERLGVTTLSALVRLPEAALIARFGAVGRTIRAWATGERIDPVQPRHRPRPIRVTLDLPAPVGNHEVLGAALTRLVERALDRPARRGRSVQALRLVAALEGSGSWAVDAVLREPSSDPDRLVFVLRSRIALTPPVRAVCSLALELTGFGPAARQDELFGREHEGARDAGGRTLDRSAVPDALRIAVRELKLRLGHSPLYRVVELDPWSRIPERRHALLALDPEEGP